MPRPKKQESEKVITYGASILPHQADEISSEARRRRNTASAFAGALLLRGWKAYLRDGSLDDPMETDESSVTEDEVRELKPVSVEMPTRRRRVG